MENKEQQILNEALEELNYASETQFRAVAKTKIQSIAADQAAIQNLLLRIENTKKELKAMSLTPLDPKVIF